MRGKNSGFVDVLGFPPTKVFFRKYALVFVYRNLSQIILNLALVMTRHLYDVVEQSDFRVRDCLRGPFSRIITRRRLFLQPFLCCRLSRLHVRCQEREYVLMLYSSPLFLFPPVSASLTTIGEAERTDTP